MVGRVALAVLLLIGFYVLALGVVGGLVALTAWLVTTEEPVGSLVFLAAILAEAMILVVGLAFLASLRKRVPPPGVPLDETAAPELWRLVRDLAAGADVRPPDSIRLIADANAWVFDEARFWGLRSGRRYLDIGMPLLLGMTVQALTAVLAHELGHYSRRDTGLYEVVYRGRETMLEVFAGLHATPWRALLRGYFRLYWLVSAAVLRERESAADRFAAVVTDGPSVAGALRELNAIAGAWRVYLDLWVAPHRFQEWAPDNISGDFGEFLAAGPVELARLRDELPDRRDRWDSHPPVAERVAALERLPARTARPNDTRPAASLVPDLSALGPRLDAVSFPVAGRTPVPFADFAILVATAELQRDADVLYRAAAGVDQDAAGLAGVLDLLAEGAGERLAAEVTLATATHADPDAAAYTLAAHLEHAVALAAVNCGAARWRYRWDAGVEAVDDRGHPLTIGSAIDAAAVRARLAELGVDESAGVPSGAEPRGEILGMMASVTANGRPHDLMILTTGLVLLPVSRYDPSRERLEHLLARLEASRAPTGGWFVPYAQISAGRILHPTRGTVLFSLRDNTLLRIEETIGAGRLATGPVDPRQILRDVVRSVGDGGSLAGRPARTAGPAADRSITEAGRAWRARSMTVFGTLLLLPGVLLSLIGFTRGVAENENLVGTGIGLAGAGILLLYRAYVERDARRAAGLGYIVFGVAILALFGTTGMLRDAPPASIPAAFGALLAGLGLARLRGRFPKRAGNGWKVASAAVASFGLVIVLNSDSIWAPAGFFLGVTALLFGNGVALAARPPDAVPWWDISRADKASLYGMIGLLGIAAFPVGTVMGILSVREARKLGRRPPLTAILAIALPLLLLAGAALVGLLSRGAS